MNFIRTKIRDVIICEPKIFGDNRGYFFEAFNQKKFEKFLGNKINFIQDNESKSDYGVLRGLHYQVSPYQQSKLVRVIEGEVLDVAVDIRPYSDTFSCHVSVLLSGENKKQLFIPKGFAHGFVVLSESAIFTYKVDNYYSFEHDNGVLFSDPLLNIDWILDDTAISLSDKDRKHPLISELVSK